MIIVIILSVLLVLGIVGAVCLKNSWKYDDLMFACVLDIIFSAVILVGCLTAILTVQLQSSVNAENALAEKTMLEYRLSKDKDIAGNELLYSDIVEFNNELRSTKKWANNPWTNWFNNKKIADIDYIEVPDMNLEE
jgi:hypothetical protein